MRHCGYKVISSRRVHIERKIGCGNHEGFEHTYHSEGFEENKDINSKLENTCNYEIEKGFDGKRDHVVIEVMVDCELYEQTFYSLILAQPVPVDGYNLPVDIRVRFCDNDRCETIRVIRSYEPWGAVGDLEYGIDLPKCRNRIPLYFTNGREFVDLRKRCCNS